MSLVPVKLGKANPAIRKPDQSLSLHAHQLELQAALSTLDRLEARAKSLVSLADRGRVVPELASLHVQAYRELVIPTYRLLYRVRGAKVLVLAVFDARRSLEDILLDRLIRVEGLEQ